MVEPQQDALSAPSGRCTDPPKTPCKAVVPQDSLRAVAERDEEPPEQLVDDTPLRGIVWDWGSVQALRGVAVRPLQFHPGTHCIVQWPLRGESGVGDWEMQGTEAAMAQLSGYACAHM